MAAADTRRDPFIGKPVMTITIIAVGKLKEAYWRDACAEYLKRLIPYAKVTVREIADIDPAKAGGVPAALDKEGAAILNAIPERSYAILLAIKGKETGSEALSSFIDDLALGGTGHLTFIIGGSDGVSDAVRARADHLMSFGPITLPHQLARIVLLEQIYRAFKINAGETYHK